MKPWSWTTFHRQEIPPQTHQCSHPLTHKYVFHKIQNPPKFGAVGLAVQTAHKIDRMVRFLRGDPWSWTSVQWLHYGVGKVVLIRHLCCS